MFRIRIQSQGEGTLSRTVSRMDAAAERTGTYLPRVLESVPLPCIFEVDTTSEHLFSCHL